MATATIATTTTPDIIETSAPLSKKAKTAIANIKKPFTAFAQAHASFTMSRAELAPKFMHAYTTWQGETHGTFIGFVRLLNPKVPADREGYRNHAVYQAADYLRRLTQETS